MNVSAPPKSLYLFGGSLRGIGCFIAGLSVQSPHERVELLELLTECERRTRWPIKSLKLDLESEWLALDETAGAENR